ncbi:MAG: alpha/beta hydrolase [Planctomycetota bacterium]|nr:MAG: alpha/beta hydrolase [Planctomycetota bacterium]
MQTNPAEVSQDFLVALCGCSSRSVIVNGKTHVGLALLVWCLVHTSTLAETNVQADVVYGHKAGMALTFDVLQPDEPNGSGVLFIVSGGWVSRWMPPEQEIAFLRPLLDRGYTVFAVRHGSSPKFVIPEIVPDVRRAVRFIRLHANDWGVDPNHLAASGWSAGGHLALMLGTTGDDGDPDSRDPVERTSSRVQAVVAYFPPTDLRPYVSDDEFPTRFPALKFDVERAAEFSPLLQVSSDDAPALLIHGDQDTLVPLWHSQKMAEALRGVGVETRLIVIEGAGHGFTGDAADRAVAAWLEWLDSHLTARAAKPQTAAP